MRRFSATMRSVGTLVACLGVAAVVTALLTGASRPTSASVREVMASPRSEAVIVYLGMREPDYLFPRSSPQQVVHRFGPEQGRELLAFASAVVAESTAVAAQPSATAGSFGDHVRRAYPELNDEATAALSDAFHFWHRCVSLEAGCG